MLTVQRLLLYAFENSKMVFLDPLFYSMAIVVAYLYKREIQKIDQTHLGKEWLIYVGQNMLLGAFLGSIISSILQVLGIKLQLADDLMMLIILSIALMTIRTQFGCLSYVLPVAYCIQGVFVLCGKSYYDFDYVELIILVGILHFLEGLLVIIRGDSLHIRMPIFEKGKLVPGYLYRQLWMIPLIFTVDNMLIPLYAILAYGDQTTKGKKQKYITGSLILVYGIIVLLLGYLVTKGKLHESGAIMLLPILHEFIFLLGHEEIIFRRRDERDGHNK